MKVTQDILTVWFLEIFLLLCFGIMLYPLVS